MPVNLEPLLNCDALSVQVPGRTLVEKLNVELRRGEIVALLGQNGSGKTMTLLTLAGLRPIASGNVTLGGVAITSLTRGQIARKLALLPQDTDDIFPATVLDTALIGRHPHIRGLNWESPDDQDLARRALQAVALEPLADRDIFTLSGGERRRLAIAQILTQAPDIYFLDEPTNHLDPQHQIETLNIFRRAADAGAGIMASMHDVNHAARFADRCLLIFGDGRWALGPTEAVLTEDALSTLYATEMRALEWRSQRLFFAVGGA